MPFTQALAQSALSVTEAEAAFHPWWDTLEDYSVYGMLMICVLAIPTANTMMSCSSDYDAPQSPQERGETRGQGQGQGGGVPTQSLYINEYCTRKHLQVFQIFFPYSLLLGPAILLLLKRLFAKTAHGVKMKKFHQVIVKVTLEEERLTDLLRDDKINLKELKSQFSGSKSFLIAFVLKIVVELTVACFYGVWITYMAFGRIFTCSLDNWPAPCEYVNFLTCSSKGAQYQCVVPHTHFYFYNFTMVLFVLFIFGLAELYSLLWAFIKPMRKLSRELGVYRKAMKRKKEAMMRRPTRFPFPNMQLGLNVLKAINIMQGSYGGLDSPDIDLLLDLLAETMSTGPAMKILTLLDETFLSHWQARPSHDANVTCDGFTLHFEGGEIEEYLGEKADSKKMTYTAKLDPPPHNRSPLINYAYNPGQKHEIRFDRLKPSTAYDLEISSYFDGTEIAEKILAVTTKPGAPEDLRVKWGFDVADENVFFVANLTWKGTADKYLVEIEEGEAEISETVDGFQFSHSTDGGEKIRVQIWSLGPDPGGDGEAEKSETCLEAELPGIPPLLRDYIDKLAEEIPQNGTGSKYLMQVKLVEEMSQQLKDLYLNLQTNMSELNEQERKFNARKVDRMSIDGGVGNTEVNSVQDGFLTDFSDFNGEIDDKKNELKKQMNDKLNEGKNELKKQMSDKINDGKNEIKKKLGHGLNKINPFSSRKYEVGDSEDNDKDNNNKEKDKAESSAGFNMKGVFKSLPKLDM